MTHDERIEAMARAMRAADTEPRKFDAHWNVRPFDEQHDEAKAWWHRMATAALAAAGVEEMVRAAAREAWDLGCMSETSDIEQRNQDAEDIVREVMSK
jgi:hypothetical protein